MAGQDFVPLALPGHQFSCVAAAAITAGQLVFISGGTLTPGQPGVSGGTPNSGNVTPTVSPTTAATSELVGVAANTVASGSPVSVYFNGIHVLGTASTISAGDPVVAAASGLVADLGATTAGTAVFSNVIGHAISANADNLVAVKLIG
jgi:predicted RecA/RadA family phage recombinase